MGPIRNKSINRHNQSSNNSQSFGHNIKYFINYIQDFITKKVLTFKIFHEHECYPIVSNILLLFEIFLNVIIINRVRYTEIDWSTYMQQVECFLNGTRDYSLISGDTGPIVYPAGHLYVYTLLYWLTDQGQNIYRAQYIFASLYLITLFIVFQLYRHYSQAPPFVLIFMCLTSYRVHSIYVLRLFNDTIAILFLYLSLLSFTGQKWIRGSIFYSLAVSIKMNILLFAPGLFLLYNEYLNKWNLIKNLAICAFVQIIIAIPFITTYPISYIKCSFNLGRIFLHKWTVNYRFLSESIFIQKQFHIILLILHLIFLIIIFRKRWMNLIENFFNKNNNEKVEHSNDDWHEYPDKNKQMKQKIGQHILMTMFISNFIGIVFARSLHYQFYIWYYHSLPFILWTTSIGANYFMTNICMLGLIELVWNIYPSTVWSSILLHLVHLVILYRLIRYRNYNIDITTITRATINIAGTIINNDNDNKIK
ncbi:alg3, alpha-1,3- mannosyltransferase [Dermatophagoides pteronyssinus]|uniref:alg3, alpha-1,3- mannosyltransferase n=1 Tax=Dermatophagoides pteronyssinus TaxID=6956 RepID=UPI003F672CCA